MAAYEHAILYVGSDENWRLKQSSIQVLEDCTNFEFVQVLNYLGQDHWQYAGKLSEYEYVLKREL